MEFTKDIIFNTTPTVNEDLTITYQGFLSNSAQLSIVYGYGDSWSNTTEKLMEKKNDGFSTTINLLDYDTFNFCFKNSNNEWDNNSYCNYIVGITPSTNTTSNFDIDTLIEELLLEPVFDSEKITKEDFDFSENVEENLDLGYQISSIISTINNTNQELTEYNTLDEILTATKIDNSTDLEVSEFDTIDDTVTFSNLVNVNDEVSTSKNVSINNVNYYDEVFEEFLDNSSFVTPIISEKNNTVTSTTNYFDNSNNEIFDEFIKNLSAITSKTEQTNATVTSTVNQPNKIVLEPLEDDNAFQTIINTSSQNEETALIETSDNFIVSSRKLGAFYLFKKRMKLIFYKVFVKIPKLLLGIDEKE